MKIQLVKILTVVVMLLIPLVTFSQKQAKLLKSESSLVIKGTSNLHDWEEKVTQFESGLTVVVDGGKLVNVENGSFKCNVKSIESGNSIMNKKTYEALKANEHPEITFKPKKVDKLVTDNNKYTCTVTGDLSIAGVTKTVSVPISGAVENSKLTIKGSTTVNMPDFSVAPPTALMGTLKTGSKIDFVFLLTFLL